jgi:hypothetical protein
MIFKNLFTLFGRPVPACAGEQTMPAKRALVPGQKGAKKRLRQYGAQLVCVCHRYDAECCLRCRTIEVIISQAPHRRPQ